MILYFSIVVHKCNPDPEKVAEAKEKFAFLKLLSETESDIAIVGMGKCFDSFYFFLNKPFIYETSKNDLQFNKQKNTFKLLNLDPNKLKTYKKNKDIMKDVCKNDPNCLTVDDDIRIMVANALDRCFMFILKNSLTEISAYQLKDLQKVTVNPTNFSGFPFSPCGIVETPSNMFYGPFRVREEWCENVNDTLYYYRSPEKCYEQIKNVAGYNSSSFLALMTSSIIVDGKNK